MSKSWGYHLILDCKGGREIRSKEDLCLRNTTRRGNRYGLRTTDD